MASYAIGETVKNAKGGIGVVRAIFTTMEGCQRYAIEDEGALDFVDEASLSRISKAIWQQLSIPDFRTLDQRPAQSV